MPAPRQASALVAAILLAGCQGSFDDGRTGAHAPQPNVLFILVDDLTVDLGAYGNAQVETPSIDRLAARGARFARAYAQFPLCHPSRASLLSGRYPEAIRVFDNETEVGALPGQAPFLPEHFRRHGYRTARFGKIVHTQHKEAIAWGDPIAAPPVAGVPEAPRERPASEDREQGEAGHAWEIPAVPGLRRLEGNRRAVGWKAVDASEAELPDGRVARRAVGFLEAQHGDHPFFLAVGFNKPHPPFVAPRPYFDLYDPRSISLRAPTTLPSDLPRAALDFALLDSGMNEQERRRALAAYYACVSFIDAQIGLLLDALDRLELWEETIVVLASDHGMHLGEHGGLWRKLTLFEEVLQVPLLLAAPGVKAGQVPGAPVELVDLYPTLSELAGLDRASGLQGRSLVPWLRDPPSPDPRTAYSVLGPSVQSLGRTVRSERYRYAVWPGEGARALWDLDNDPDLERNLAGDPRYRRLEAELQRLLDERARAAAMPASDSQSSR